MFTRVWPFLITAIAAFAQPANPPRLGYATYIGTAGSYLYGLAVDQSGNAYVTGALGCASLTKLNPTGTAVVWSVCLPVSQVNSVAVDAASYVYVAGSTQASSNVFPTSTIIKLSPDAKQTIYTASMVGAYAAKLVLDQTGNVYLTGLADKTFTPTRGAYLTTGGYSFAAKLSTLGTVEYATYLDFTSTYGLNGDIAVDSRGQAWVVGTSCPAFAPSNCDIFSYGTANAIRKLDAKGATVLVSKTFGGGAGADHGPAFFDSALGTAVDATDSVWVVGRTESASVPTTPGALQPQGPPGAREGSLSKSIGYTVKLSSSGDLLYGTYLGTQAPDGTEITSVTVDNQSRPYFPLVTDFRDTIYASSTIMALTADGSSVVLSTHLPGLTLNIALDGKGGLYVNGDTSKMIFLTTPGAYQQFFPGGSLSGFVAKFDLTTVSPPRLLSVANAASFNELYNREAQGVIAPGEIVTLFGRGFPPNPKVTFDAYAAPVLYADANQINAVVPFEVSAPSTVVSVQGADGQFTLPVWPAVPALFTSNGSGFGAVAALNEDGSVNSTSNPAKAGSIVSVYMTGLGAMTPPIGDGELGPLQPPFPAPILGVGATVNGVVTPILFAGQAPGLIAGAVQVNVRIPAGTASGNAFLIVYVGNYRSQLGLTSIAVQ
ncbi:MAG: SBBP repeat-containing protein [Bryobacteraceae bacterium]